MGCLRSADPPCGFCIIVLMKWTPHHNYHASNSFIIEHDEHEGDYKLPCGYALATQMINFPCKWRGGGVGVTSQLRFDYAKEETVFFQRCLEQFSSDIVPKLAKTLTRVQRCCVQTNWAEIHGGFAAYSPHTYTDIQTDICLPTCSSFWFFPLLFY